MAFDTLVALMDKPGVVDAAAELLRQGEVVAFPTETVYGLGANAWDERAVRKIYEAKGRPADNPLIVHVSKLSQVRELVSKFGSLATVAVETFWPGPLTLILPKSPRVSPLVTAGLDTIAIRMPGHSGARRLIDACGFPIAAPSANRSGKPSPTTAQDVLEDMDGRIPMIVDGGPAAVGLESTVVDLSCDIPVVLRPGAISLTQLQRHLGRITLHSAIDWKAFAQGQTPRSPGMKYQHYAPQAPMTVITGSATRIPGRMRELYEQYAAEGKRVGLIVCTESAPYFQDLDVLISGSRFAPEAIARTLFAHLRHMDREGVDVVLCEGVDNFGIGLAIMNRMLRAANFQMEVV